MHRMRGAHGEHIRTACVIDIALSFMGLFCTRRRDVTDDTAGITVWGLRSDIIMCQYDCVVAYTRARMLTHKHMSLVSYRTSTRLSPAVTTSHPIAHEGWVLEPPPLLVTLLIS